MTTDNWIAIAGIVVVLVVGVGGWFAVQSRKKRHVQKQVTKGDGTVIQSGRDTKINR
ncbi:LPXTG cell wall anchor domain-containing protein [Mesorhizobium sp. PAMC28654]|uniref:LPXTG cell wall anchor domain-containing protein n=1 Tax=Mesorhizobium sp. PAMC28654 TaxID=2880934 RepID=UPI001D0AD55D|nr:LPXTG cell wall anchor domain-containing protein [Mesorhizobium sp. PAMC28654]UDL87762.1 LPXTG cell wall anchor domain-containing protein [Mesorhizobium sp. PAMC28654]